MTPAADHVAAMAWIASHRTCERPTEITVRVRERVGPTYWHHVGRGGWYAALTTHPNPLGEVLDECDHLHDSEDEAWSCAADLARALARDIVEGDAR